MASKILFVLALIVTVVVAELRGNEQREEMSRVFTWSVKLTNLAYDQPFGPFFVVSHNRTATRLFNVGRRASSALAVLAESGSPAPLIAAYNGTRGVKLATSVATADGPLFPGRMNTFMVETSTMHPMISLASMAGNTNDCFAGISRFVPVNGAIMDLPGYDSGSETNDELCVNIPGPACAAFPKTNRTDLNDGGEGFVHVHRGIHGVGDLDESEYDWRNPMLRVEFTFMY